jgi:peptide/nickel transport system substrate-binding protein
MVRKIATKAATGFKSKPSCPGLTYWWKYLPKSPSRIAAVSLPLCVPLIRPRGPRNRAAACSVLLLALAICGTPGALRQAHAAEPRHAIAMHGAPALPEGFTRLPYADPAAPKGGRLVQGVLGTFDSLNPLIVKGIAPPSIRGYVIESLMARGYDEPFTLYGLIARAIETDAQRSYVTFHLDPAAKFSDGKPVTAEDIIFSWQLLRDKGRPNHRTYYAKVAKAEALGEQAVRFDLSGSDDRELALILGLMPVLAKHAVKPETFEETSFQAPLGTGPYVVGEVDPGKSVTLKRNPDYWGRDLAINRGLWNFDEVRFDYYREANSHLEAFKRGLYDLRNEHDPGRWQTAYDFAAVRDGRVLKETLPTGVPKLSSYFVFNTRRAVFSDIRVREAISLLFDFEWINHGYFFDLYQRSASYFDGSELSSHGRPADQREKALLAPFTEAVRPDVLDGTWSPPVSDGSGRDRVALKRALDLFAGAGYELRGTELVERKSGRPLTFEILVTARDEERLALLFSQSLKRAGIAARVRVVDAVQYEGRRLTYDFDMIENRWDQSLSPGNEQAFYWGSAAADQPGTRNYMGVKSPAVDAMIAALLKAEDRGDFVAAVRALDRVLISGFYVIPLFYLPAQWVARWTTVARPAATSLYGYLPETWWREPKTP